MTLPNQIAPEVSATWWTAAGPVESTRWLPPQEGYIRIEIGDTITLSLSGFETACLLFYLNGHDAGNILDQALATDGVVAWEEEDTTTIQVGNVMLTIDHATKEELCCRLEQILGSPSPDTEDVDWCKEGF